MRTVVCIIGLTLFNCATRAPLATALAPEVREYVKVDAPVVALVHARLIDGTGSAARDQQTVVIREGKILFVGRDGDPPLPRDARVLDMNGRTVIPGLIDMHGHRFYTAGNVFTKDGKLPAGGITLNERVYNYPRLYLPPGVTDVHTTRPT